MAGLLFGIPAYRGQVHAGHVSQAVLLERALAGRTPLSFFYADSCSLDWARNTLLYAALTRGADWLLMSDADTYCLDGGALVRMIAEGSRAGAAVVAAPVLTRRHGDAYNVAVLDPEERNLTRDELAGQVLEVPRIGTACMAIDCAWIRDHLPHPWFTSTQTLNEGRPAWTGEDFSFCDRVRAAGGVIRMDGRVEVVHVGASNELGILQSFGAEVVP